MDDAPTQVPTAVPARHPWRRRALVAGGILTLLFALGAAAFVSSEARKEVVYLCGNFAPGTTEQSVIRQLDTANFLRRERVTGPRTTTIVVDSAWNLGLWRCVIELDGNGTVTRARVE